MQLHPTKGSNLTTVRGINERLILHLIRVHRELTKAEATRMTGLSANAISVIFRALEKEGLLLRGAPIRGRVGQPSVPMRLNPSARYYIGFKVGRRSHDMVLVNFTGEVLAAHSAAHRFPTPDNTLDFLDREIDTLIQEAGVDSSDLCGFNIAMPFELWSWASDFGAPAQSMHAWRHFDLTSAVQARVPWPVTLENDGTAACRAELVFGQPSGAQDIVYFFVGTFIGGGIVLNGSVFPGRKGSAGGFGPLRVPDEPGGERLVDHASLVVLEQMIAHRNPALAGSLYNQVADWSGCEPELTQWVERAARSLAHAIVSALAVLDFERIVVDGALPAPVRERLVREINTRFDGLDLQGVGRPAIVAGHFGHMARAIGAAAHQISTESMIDQNTLLRDTPTALHQPGPGTAAS